MSRAWIYTALAAPQTLQVAGLSAVSKNIDQDVENAKNIVWELKAGTGNQQLQALALMAQTNEQSAEKMGAQSTEMLGRTEALFVIDF